MTRLGLLVLMVLAALGGGRARAQPRPTLTAELSRSQVTLDEEVQLTFRVAIQGGGARVERFLAPSLREFEVRDTASQRRVELSLGAGLGVPEHTRIEERIYLVKPRKVGKLAIGPAAAWVGGREIRSRGITLTVLPAGSGGVTPAPAPTPAKMKPLATPRSVVGIHLATRRFEAG